MPSSKSARWSDQQINDWLRELDPLVIALVKKRLRRFPSDARDDVCQQCRVALWQNVLPQYDPAAGPLTAFVRLCLDRVIEREVSKLERITRHEPLPESDLPMPNSSDVEELADQITEFPEQFLTLKQSRLLKLTLTGSQPQTIAIELGIEPHAVSKAILRLRKKIRSLVHTAA